LPKAGSVRSATSTSSRPTRAPGPDDQPTGGCPFRDFNVLATDCWHPDEGIEALIGRDILDLCFFQYMGPDRRFTVAF
jgi:hypothetical protein